MRRDSLSEEVGKAIDDCCGRLLAIAEIGGPPVDAFTLAKRLGMVVGIDSQQNGRARCVRLFASTSREQAAILIRPDPREERRHWAVAHEIGEHYSHEVFGSLGVDPADEPLQAREGLANEMANRLLLPTPWFMSLGAKCDWDLYELKRSFATASYELLARRVLDRAEPAIMTIFDQGRWSFHGDNFAGERTPLTPLEKQVWSRCHASTLPQAAADRSIRTRAWAIHEAEWKREILLTEPIDVELMNAESIDAKLE